MHFSSILLTTLATGAATVHARSSHQPVLRPRQAAAVFSQQTYNEISISGGTAGNAEAEALAVFEGIDRSDLAAVNDADVDFLDAVNGICNDAEEEAFNPAIEEAGEDSEEGAALQRGKIKNKVLKIEASILRLQIEQAQGSNVTADLTEEQTKLQSNIDQDEAEAGNASTKLEFDASTADD